MSKPKKKYFRDRMADTMFIILMIICAGLGIMLSKDFVMRLLVKG